MAHNILIGQNACQSSSLRRSIAFSIPIVMPAIMGPYLQNAAVKIAKNLNGNSQGP